LSSGPPNQTLHLTGAAISVSSEFTLLVGALVALVAIGGGVPIRVEIEKWRILPVGCSTINRPPGKAAAGGMRHGEA